MFKKLSEGSYYKGFFIKYKVPGEDKNNSNKDGVHTEVYGPDHKLAFTLDPNENVSKEIEDYIKDHKIKTEGKLKSFDLDAKANYQGIDKLPNGKGPFIYQGKYGEIVVGTDESDPTDVIVAIFAFEPDEYDPGYSAESSISLTSEEAIRIAEGAAKESDKSYQALVSYAKRNHIDNDS